MSDLDKISECYAVICKLAYTEAAYTVRIFEDEAEAIEHMNELEDGQECNDPSDRHDFSIRKYSFQYRKVRNNADEYLDRL